MRMLARSRTTGSRKVVAHTGPPASASAVLSPSARSSVLLPAMFEPVTISAEPGPGSCTSLSMRTSGTSSGWPRPRASSAAPGSAISGMRASGSPNCKVASEHSASSSPSAANQSAVCRPTRAFQRSSPHRTCRSQSVSGVMKVFQRNWLWSSAALVHAFSERMCAEGGVPPTASRSLIARSSSLSNGARSAIVSMRSNASAVPLRAAARLNASRAVRPLTMSSAICAPSGSSQKPCGKKRYAARVSGGSAQIRRPSSFFRREERGQLREAAERAAVELLAGARAERGGLELLAQLDHGRELGHRGLTRADRGRRCGATEPVRKRVLAVHRVRHVDALEQRAGADEVDVERVGVVGGEQSITAVLEFGPLSRDALELAVMNVVTDARLLALDEHALMLNDRDDERAREQQGAEAGSTHHTTGPGHRGEHAATDEGQ